MVTLSGWKVRLALAFLCGGALIALSAQGAPGGSRHVPAPPEGPPHLGPPPHAMPPPKAPPPVLPPVVPPKLPLPSPPPATPHGRALPPVFPIQALPMLRGATPVGARPTVSALAIAPRAVSPVPASRAAGSPSAASAPTVPSVPAAIVTPPPPGFIEACEVNGFGTIYVDANRQVLRQVAGPSYEVVGRREATVDPVACGYELSLPHERLCVGRDGVLSNRDLTGPPPRMGQCRMVLR